MYENIYYQLIKRSHVLTITVGKHEPSSLLTREQRELIRHTSKTQIGPVLVINKQFALKFLTFFFLFWQSAALFQ